MKNLFRVYNSLYGMTYFDLYNSSDILDRYLNIFGKSNEEIDFFEMQFINLFDIHDKLIFEGDIVRKVSVDFNTNSLSYQEGYIVKVVKWQQSRGGWNIYSRNKEQKSNYWEVVGNIYEHKELLEQENKA